MKTVRQFPSCVIIILSILRLTWGNQSNTSVELKAGPPTSVYSPEGILDILNNYKWTAIVSIITILLALSYAMMTIPRRARLLKNFPMVPKFPIVGSLPLMMGPPEKMTEHVTKAIELFGRRFVFWMGHRPYVVILDPEGAQKVLASTKHIEKGKDYKKFHWLLGNGLVTSNGAIWKEDRKLLSPAFKYQSFDGFLEQFNKQSRILTDILIKELKSSEESNGTNKSMNLHPLLCRATMDMITESALGQTSTFQYNIQGEFFDSIQMAFDSFRTMVFYPWLNFPIIWDIFGLGRQDKVCKKFFSEFLSEMIRKRKEILSSQRDSDEASATRPFIDSILDTKSYEDITAHILTIFGAGFETTASGMNCTLFLLAQDDKCQAKVHEELDQVFGVERDDPNRDRDVTVGDLAELKYLEMCIKEALRIFPSAPMIFRHSTEDIPLDDGQIIPKGCEVVFAIREMHRDPSTFPDPEKFDPDRFLPDECVNRHPFAYIPFSAGPRNCLGMKYAMMQMKSSLAHLLRKFSVSTNQRREDMKVVYGMVLETLPSIELTLVPRN